MHLNKLFTIPVMVILATGVLYLGGCDTSDETSMYPAAMVGTWTENGYNRQMVLSANGDFEYLAPPTGPPVVSQGRGAWSVLNGDLIINLTSGHFRWLTSINNAPINFTFQYQVSNESLSLTFDILGELSTAYYTRMN